MIGRMKGAPATFGLFVAIVIGFLVEVATGAWKNPDTLHTVGAVSHVDVFHDHEYWRLVAAMFLHGDGTTAGTVLHLALNLFALYQIGTLYEMMFGSRRFLLIYFLTGIVSFITTAMRPGVSSVGASGAIFGIMGAFVFSVFRSPKWRHQRVARSIVVQCVFWILMNIVIGTQVARIDNYAHLGGLAAGLLLGALLPHRTPPPPPTSVIDVQSWDR